MTDEEIEIAKTAKKTAIKAYINDSDPVRSQLAIQVLINALINNAGSLENLTMLQNALDVKFGVGS